VGTRSCMCHGGWEVWAHWGGGGFMPLYVMFKLIYLGLWCHILCVVELYYIYSCTYTMYNTNCGFYSYSLGSINVL